MEELERIIEALLFASPEPLTIARIRSIVPGLEKQQVVEAINSLRQEYAGESRSFQIVEIGGGFQLTTKPDYAVWVGKLFEERSRQKLSRAALETLAIIAYKQPVMRSTIEGIRGVNVDGVLRTLMERDLVRIVGRGEVPGRPLLFGTTRQFLIRFGLNRLSDLPKIEEIEELIASSGQAQADQPTTVDDEVASDKTTSTDQTDRETIETIPE
ncbi:MAG TPA: SMC-Scp complex subunit ScpB [Firmicutes bacterium]|nr:SMC-Scp complex subunit ScpB [Bacillota bacterium]